MSVKLIRKITAAEHLDYEEKFAAIKEIIDNEQDLTDQSVILSIMRLVDTIGKTIDRIDKVERKSDFLLTPEGLKILMVGVSEVINEVVLDREMLGKIYHGLENIHTSRAQSTAPRSLT